jgi:hypothetical protein
MRGVGHTAHPEPRWTVNDGGTLDFRAPRGQRSLYIVASPVLGEADRVYPLGAVRTGKTAWTDGDAPRRVGVYS